MKHIVFVSIQSKEHTQNLRLILYADNYNHDCIELIYHVCNLFCLLIFMRFVINLKQKFSLTNKSAFKVFTPVRTYIFLDLIYQGQFLGHLESEAVKSEFCLLID